MTNKTRSLDDIPVAYMMDDSWVWKDDMMTWPADDGFYDAEEEYNNAAFTQNELDFDDHPICGEFPHDSIVAPRGFCPYV